MFGNDEVAVAPHRVPRWRRSWPRLGHAAVPTGGRFRWAGLALVAGYLIMWRLPHAGVQAGPVDGSLVSLLSWHLTDLFFVAE